MDKANRLKAGFFPFARSKTNAPNKSGRLSDWHFSAYSHSLFDTPIAAYLPKRLSCAGVKSALLNILPHSHL
ncbi:MAG: hypothetical protein RR619_11345, partial [Raoultibacter sp.]